MVFGNLSYWRGLIRSNWQALWAIRAQRFVPAVCFIFLLSMANLPAATPAGAQAAAKSGQPPVTDTPAAASTEAGKATSEKAESPAEPMLPDEQELGALFLTSLGGRLYDDVWVVTGLPRPEGANPGYPAGTDILARDTWRCVSCHGWDYRGKDGERGEAVPGLEAPSLGGLQNFDLDEIISRIRTDTHPFPADQLPDLGDRILAMFINRGQYSLSLFYNENGKPVGDAELGQDMFEGACITCHRLDGRRFLRGEMGDHSSLGWIVRNRPAQSVHKIMNGAPATEMLSLRFLSTWQIADLIAYIQTLDPLEE